MESRVKNKKVSFYTLGCKLNFSETSGIARQFEEKGYEKISFEKLEASIYVINTCSVTDNADKKLKDIVKKIPSYAKVVVIGCYAQLKPQEILELKRVDLVLGASQKFNILSYLDQLDTQNTSQAHTCEIQDVNNYVGSYSIGDRTRAFLKVQDGCDYKCSYCTIPLARGISRSDSLENILDKALEIVSKGIKEIVLTGVNIGDYGKGEYGNKKHEHTFLDLLKYLEQVTGLDRIRISSIEPNLFSSDIIDFVSKSNKIVPHFHIPLQSGSDTILALMRRRYKTKLYKERIEEIKSKIPNVCIGIDVIVGFPGETTELFNETLEFIKELEASYLHVFSYSERDNTEALKIKEIVSKQDRKLRSKQLRILSERMRKSFYQEQLNSKRPVLFEHENKEGYIYGFTDNYVRVKMPWHKDLVNSLQLVKLNTEVVSL